MGFYRGLAPVGGANLLTSRIWAVILGKFAARRRGQEAQNRATNPTPMLIKPRKRS